MANAFNFFRLFFPLSKKKKDSLVFLQKFVSPTELKDLKYMLRQKSIDVEMKEFGVSKALISEFRYPVVSILSKDSKEKEYVQGIVNRITPIIKKEAYGKIKQEELQTLIAANIVGFESIKEAVSLQLFAHEKMHILLLGDPGTGKTEILRAIYDLAPVSSFGLGSGTSGAGLSVTMSGKEMTKGLLPMADGGICCIDELNLLKKEDAGSLYNAMEKGFITYTKGGKNLRFEANINVLATANPKGDSFSSEVKKLKAQLPFDSALLSRFHLIFIIRKPSKEAFLAITKNIIRQEKKNLNANDIAFIKEFVEFARAFNVSFDTKYESLITDFIDKLKDDEKKFLIEINPRLVVGIVNMCKARARLYLRDKVVKEDIESVLEIVRKSLYEMY